MNFPRGNTFYHFDAYADDAYEQFQRMYEIESERFQAKLCTAFFTTLENQFNAVHDFQKFDPEYPGTENAGVEFYSPGNGNLFIRLVSKNRLERLLAEGVEIKQSPKPELHQAEILHLKFA